MNGAGGEQLGEAGGDPPRRVRQRLGGRVLAERGQQLGHGPLGPVQVDRWVGAGDPQVGSADGPGGLARQGVDSSGHVRSSGPGGVGADAGEGGGEPGQGQGGQ